MRPKWVPRARNSRSAAEEGALTARVRRDTQFAGLMFALALCALFGYLTFHPGRGRYGGPESPVPSAILATGLFVLACYFAWRMRTADRWFTVIDETGVHDRSSGKTLRWSEVYAVTYDGSGPNIIVAEHPESGGYGITIDVAGSGRGDAEMLASIERFSRAAGRELELPTRPSAPAAARPS